MAISVAGQELVTGGDHRFGSLVDGLDDLGVVDPAEVSGCDREVGVTELALDHDQRDPLARHLNSVRVPQLVLVPTSAQAPSPAHACDLALKAGVPVKVVSERLGHESPAFTLRQYAHVIPGMQAAAAAVVAELVRDQTAVDSDAA
jgi:hypothetical protein